MISLITDPGNFFDYDTGIYVDGVNFDPNNPTWTGNCFMTGIEWERDVCIQYFTTSGELVLDQDAGVRIHGGIMRNVAQKSLRLYARKEDGQKIATRDLPAPPVWDGLAAARGDCIIGLKDGTVLCLR